MFWCQITEKVELLNGKEKRKREVEDKLQVLNAKKHSLVLVLKQVSSGFDRRSCSPSDVIYIKNGFNL